MLQTIQAAESAADAAAAAAALSTSQSLQTFFLGGEQRRAKFKTF